MSRVLTKLQNIARSAKHFNPAINPPHIGGTSWLASTQYPLPGANSSMTVGNGGNAYVLVQPGTSASSGGPTGTTAGLITDGSCKWSYVGPVQAPTVTATPTLPTFAFSQVFYAPDLNSNVMSYTGGQPAFISSQQTFFPSTYIGNNSGVCFGSYSNCGATVSFQTDAPIIAVATAHAAPGGGFFRVIVDGRYINLNQMQIDTTGGFSVYTVIDFTNWGGHHRGKLHRIDFEFSGGGIGFHGVFLSSQDTILPLAETDYMHPVFFGDSFSTIAQTTIVRGIYGDYAARQLGLPGCAMSGIAGTGLINQGPSNAWPRFYDPELAAPRINDLKGYDFAVVMGGTNDANYSQADVSAAATRFAQAARKVMGPETPLFFFGCNAGSTGPNTASFQTEDALRVGLEAAHDPCLAFIPMIRRTKPYIFGTGSAPSPNGSGNADYYLTSGHPNDAGSAYFGYRVAADITEAAERMSAAHTGTICLSDL